MKGPGPFGGRRHRRRGAASGRETGIRKFGKLRLSCRPVSRGCQPSRQRCHVVWDNALRRIYNRLVSREKVEAQGREVVRAQVVDEPPLSRAPTIDVARVRDDHQAARVVGNRQVGEQTSVVRWNANQYRSMYQAVLMSIC